MGNRSLRSSHSWWKYSIPVALLHVLGIGLLLVVARNHPAIWGIGLLTIATVISVQWAQSRLLQFEEVGGVVGASVSSLFLLTVGVINFTGGESAKVIGGLRSHER